MKIIQFAPKQPARTVDEEIVDAEREKQMRDMAEEVIESLDFERSLMTPERASVKD